MKRSFTKHPQSIHASYDGIDYQPDFSHELDRFEQRANVNTDYSYQVIEQIKHGLFDLNDNPQPAADGTDHGLLFVTFAGDGHSFIVNYDGEEYRVQVTKEI